MKNFDVRMKEILRRSEEMKKMQQRRKKLLLTTIPVALCCVLCLGVFPFLEGGRTGETGGANGGMAAPEHSERHDCITVVIPAQTVSPEMHNENNYSQNTTGFQVRGNEQNQTFDNPAMIEALRTMLVHLTADDPYAGAPAGGTGSTPGEGETTAGKAQPKEGYVLSFSDDHGVLSQYHLYKNQLTDLSTGATKILSEQDATVLYNMLGVPME